MAIAFDRLVPSWLMRMRRFNVYEMDPESVSSPVEAADIVVRWSTSEAETQAVEKFMGPQRSVVDVGAEHMKVCFAEVDGELAGAIWMTSNIFMESGLTVRYELSDQQVWLFGAYVEKRFRRHGVYSRILEFILPDLEAAGKSQILLSVNPDNIASRKVHERHARRTVGTAYAFRFLGIAMCTTVGDIAINRRFTWNHRSNPIVLRFAK